MTLGEALATEIVAVERVIQSVIDKFQARTGVVIATIDLAPVMGLGGPRQSRVMAVQIYSHRGS